MTEATAQSAEATAGATSAPVKYKRRLVGRVTSDKMDKTIVVEVIRYKMDRMYKKYVKVSKRYQAHDENNEHRAGDRVEIIEHRPLSKRKRWKVSALIERPLVE